MKKLSFFLLLLLTFTLTACWDQGVVGVDGADEVPRTLSCNLGMNEYKVEGTPIQFCYDPAWGEVMVEDLGSSAGVLKRVSFAGMPDGPKLEYQSTDFAPLEGEAERFCFDCIILYAPDESITTAVAEELGVSANTINVRKGSVSTMRSARVHIGKEIRHYVPTAFEGYHMLIYGSDDLASEVDEFAFDMVL